MNSLYFGRYGSWVFQCTSGGWCEEMCTLLLFHIRFNCTTKSALLKIAVILENHFFKVVFAIIHLELQSGPDLLIKKILCFFLIIWPYNPFFPQNSLDHSRLFIPNKHDTVEFFLFFETLLKNLLLCCLDQDALTVNVLCDPRTASVACHRSLWMMQVNIWPWSPHLLG